MMKVNTRNQGGLQGRWDAKSACLIGGNWRIFVMTGEAGQEQSISGTDADIFHGKIWSIYLSVKFVT